VVLRILYTPSVVPVALAFIFTGLFLGSLAEEGIVKSKELSFIENPRAGFASVLALVFALVLALTTGFVYTQK